MDTQQVRADYVQALYRENQDLKRQVEALRALLQTSYAVTRIPLPVGADWHEFDRVAHMRLSALGDALNEAAIAGTPERLHDLRSTLAEIFAEPLTYRPDADVAPKPAADPELELELGLGDAPAAAEGGAA